MFLINLQALGRIDVTPSEFGFRFSGLLNFKLFLYDKPVEVLISDTD